MSVVVIVESVVLAVLAFFVVALVYSYAGLLRRVEALDAPGPPGEGALRAGGLRGGPDDGGGSDASDVSGVTPDGSAVVAAVDGARHATLLAFLSSGCTGCRTFWQGVGAGDGPTLPAGVRLVVVTKGPSDESPSAVAALAPPGVDVVMSSEAWRDYRVPGSPYFVLVDGPSGSVLGGGTGPGWREVLDLMRLATGDAGAARHSGPPAGPPAAARERTAGATTVGGREREREQAIDEVLLGAGITPGHPSLYPRPPERPPSVGGTDGAPRDGGR